MTDALKRALRTFFQGFLGVLAIVAIPPLQNAVQAVVGGGGVEIDINLWRSVVFAAIAGGIIALISWGQNELENKTSMPAVLKDKPPLDEMDPRTWTV